MSPEETSYDIAYYLLPFYASKRTSKLHELAKRPARAAQFFYVMACGRRGIEPDERLLDHYRFHVGSWGKRSYYVIEYPTPTPVDYTGVDPMLIVEGDAGVLAPHFSLFVFDSPDAAAEYFVLGQAPFGGGTTLRKVDDGANANLGPGPPANLTAFLDTVRRRVERPPPSP